MAVEYADGNLVRLPDAIEYVTVASPGCCFVTSFRAVIDQGRVCAGQRVAVHGCGGVGLSAVMIAHAAGANMVAGDIADDKLALAQALGAAATVNARQTHDVADAVHTVTRGGAHISLDALGSPARCFISIANLRKRGKHIQVGLMLGEHSTPSIPMAKVIANELEILGSHGIQAHRYPDLLAMIETSRLHPQKLIGKTIPLAQMDQFPGAGVTVIDSFT
jgi:alcohol dehydrogenase